MAKVYLEEIIENKRKRIEERSFDFDKLMQQAKKVTANKSFFNALKKPGLSIIGEIKKASPSKGLIKEDFHPLKLAKEYEQCVDAISVLTEEHYFQGSDDYLRDVSKESLLPTLCKDFVFTKEQILNAKVLGASAVLLIVAILPYETLLELYEFASSIGLDVLVEVHTAEEVETALKINPKIIGINNRNLDTFVTDVETTVQLRKRIPSGILVVSESGIFTHKEIEQLNQVRFDAILVGESFMRRDDMVALALELKQAYRKLPEIKVCGIKNLDELSLIQEFHVSYFGMIFVEKSKRFVTLHNAKELIQQKGSLQAVGVFQNAPIEVVKQHIKELNLDIVQLHGTEPQDYIDQLDVPVWKVIPVQNKKDLDYLKDYQNVNGFLFDTKSGDASGGTGTAFAWEFLKDTPRTTTWILAGGLGSDNVLEAIDEVQPDILDFNSKLEVNGFKTREKLEELFLILQEGSHA